MEIKRKLYQKLLNWKKNCNGTKALLIEGARRIGKSTIAEEFLIYMKEELLLEYIEDCFQKMHEKAMHLFKEYMLVGGMPQSIIAFAKNGRDFAAADIEKREILDLYRDDIKKAAKRYNSRVSALFENIPAY